MVEQFSGFFVSQGEVNISGIKYALKLEGLEDRKDLAQKIIIYLTNALKAGK